MWYWNKSIQIPSETSLSNRWPPTSVISASPQHNGYSMGVPTCPFLPNNRKKQNDPNFNSMLRIIITLFNAICAPTQKDITKCYISTSSQWGLKIDTIDIQERHLHFPTSVHMHLSKPNYFIYSALLPTCSFDEQDGHKTSVK